MLKKLITLGGFLLLISILYISCIKENFETLAFVTANTDRAIARGVNVIRLSGTLDGLDTTFEPDATLKKTYGFLWSKSDVSPELGEAEVIMESITTPYQIGTVFEKNIEDLSLTDTYYYRAYVQWGDRINYGEILTFNLQENVQLVFDNSILLENDIVTLNAALFLSFQDSVDDHGLVYSNRMMEPEAGHPEAVTISLGATNNAGLFQITTRPLALNMAYTARAYAVVAGKPIYSEVLNFATEDGWKLVARSITENSFTPAGFGTTEEAFVGMGCEEFCVNDEMSELWQFTADTLISAVKGAPEGRIGAVHFVLDNMLYYGLGRKGTEYLTDFWQLDPKASANGWQQLDDFEDLGREYATVIVNETEKIAYICGGIDDFGTYDEMWIFDPSESPSWDLSDIIIPGSMEGNSEKVGRSQAYGFAVNGQFYLGGGQNDGAALNDLYVLQEDQWILEGTSPMPARRSAVTFTHDNKAYVTLGNDNTPEGNLYDLWEYDPMSNSWTEKTRWPTIDFKRSANFAFKSQNRLFAGGFNEDELALDIWEYFPEN